MLVVGRLYSLAPLPMVLWNSCDMRGPRGPKRCGGSPLASSRAMRMTKVHNYFGVGFHSQCEIKPGSECEQTLKPSHFWIIRLALTRSGHAHCSGNWAWSWEDENTQHLIKTLPLWHCKGSHIFALSAQTPGGFPVDWPGISQINAIKNSNWTTCTDLGSIM